MGAVRSLPVTPFFALLAIDIFNGAFALVAEGPATQAALVLKLLVLVYLAWTILWTPRLAAMVLAVTALLVACLGLVELERESLLLFVKSAATLVLAALLQRYAKAVEPAAFTRFLRAVLLVIASSLLLGLLGVGHERYGDSEALLSANGFLPAGNEINIALIGIFWWLSARRRAGYRELDETVLYGLCIALLVLSSSKTTIAGALVIALYHARLRFGSVMVIGLALAAGVWLLVNSGIWERWTYFYHFYLDEGVLSALTNGRFGRVEDFVTNWRDLPWLGVGVLASGGGYIESDPLDLLLNFGLLGALLFALWARVLWVVCQSRWVPWLLILGASALAGHVIYSVFAAPLLAAAFTARPERPGTTPRRTLTSRSASQAPPA
jgi:hypothetical protein